MGKLYKKYISLKIENPNKIYLFKVGIFYIFLDDDARLMSSVLELKLTKFNSVIYKCGFPVNSSEKYFNLLKKYNYAILWFWWSLVLFDTFVSGSYGLSSP